MTGYRPGEDYLTQYRNLLRWMNRCVACGHQGHKPELPENIYPRTSVAAQNLRRFFRPLSLDEDGLCQVCRSVIASSQLFTRREEEGGKDG